MASTAGTRIVSIESYSQLTQRTMKTSRIPRRISLRRCSHSFAKATFEADGGPNGRGRNEDARALEVKRTFSESSQEISSSAPTRRRPLTASDLSSSVSRSRLKVAYQGLPGAFSESAAEKAYPNCEAVPCELFETAFEAVESWKVDRAVLPIENSLGGSIHRNYDLLLRHNLHIVGEVKYAVRHCLLANHGVKIENLKRVLSHPQALAQCEYNLTKLGVVREAVDDTAGAAKFVAANKLQDAGAVASSLAGELYGLNILARDIQDDSDNVTRFLMLAREPIIPGINRPFKTSIVFSLDEGPGMLFKALAVFAMRDINLTKIESRPQQRKSMAIFEDGCHGSPMSSLRKNITYSIRIHQEANSGVTCVRSFDYLFHVDFEASMASENTQNALRHLEEFATFLRVLGSYPIDVSQT